MSAAELALLVRAQAEKIAALEHQIEWFRRQIFGHKSERFAPEPDPNQLYLGETFPVPTQPLEARQSIPAHTRRVAQHDGADSGEDLKFFDESKVPVQTITLVHADVEGLSADQYEIIGEKVTYGIAQRPGAYHVLKYRRPVIKLKAQAQILALPAPTGVLEGSRADVSFAAASALERQWHPGQPALADAARPGPDQPAGPDLRGPVRLDPLKPHQSHGRDADQGRALRSRQDAHRLLLADLRGTR
jgi:hypothetical protein